MGSYIARRVVFVLFVFITMGAPVDVYAVAGGCGQPVNQSGLPTATDALFTLRASVGAETCALAICDVDGSCAVTATDALRVLSKAVGRAVSLDCSCSVSSMTTITSTTTTTTVTTTTTTTTVPAASTSTTITTTTTATTTSTTTTTMPPAVQLHLENVTGQSMEVWIDTDLCINAYQFTVSGATVAAASGGLTQAAGLSIQAGSTLVLAWSSGAEQQIAAGSSGQLIQVSLGNSSGFACAGAWGISDCDSLAVPDASIYYRRPDGSSCRSNEPGCFLCDF